MIQLSRNGIVRLPQSQAAKALQKLPCRSPTPRVSETGVMIQGSADTTETELNKERWRYFRWTPRTAWISFMYAVFVPSVVGYAFAKTDVSSSGSVICKTLAAAG